MTTYTMAVACAAPFEETLAAVRAGLAEEGFGVITEVDLSATLRQKLGAEVPAEVILGACNPQFAHQAIMAEPSIAALLPCNVVVRSTGDSTVVEAFDPAALAVLAGGESGAIDDLAGKVRERLNAALARVSASAG